MIEKWDFKLRDLTTRIPILDLKKQYSILIDDEQKTSIRLMVVITFLFSIFYFLLPIDVIPDVLLGLGYLDDLTIYAVLREISYKGAERDVGIRGAIHHTLRSKLFIAVTLAILFVILLVTIVLSTSYLW
jgi:uncharacterized membrane protein YkvA (DUF1232 family)